MPRVKFVKEKKEIEVPVGTSIRNAAKQAGINTNFLLNGLEDQVCPGLNKLSNCHGLGMCGTCRVLVTEGKENVNSMTLRETAKFKTPFVAVPDPIACLAYVGNEDKMRLACCTKVNGDVSVETNPAFNLFGENFFS
jgi:ferredoxin